MRTDGKYRLLRSLCKDKGIEGQDLADEFGRTTNYISSRMTGKCPWNQTEIYHIMDMLGQPYEYIPYIFPARGMWAGDLPSKEPSAEERFGRRMIELIKEAGMA